MAITAALSNKPSQYAAAVENGVILRIRACAGRESDWRNFGGCSASAKKPRLVGMAASAASLVGNAENNNRMAGAAENRQKKLGNIAKETAHRASITQASPCRLGHQPQICRAGGANVGGSATRADADVGEPLTPAPTGGGIAGRQYSRVSRLKRQVSWHHLRAGLAREMRMAYKEIKARHQDNVLSPGMEN